mgnify:CR=1 FL=1
MRISNKYTACFGRLQAMTLVPRKETVLISMIDPDSKIYLYLPEDSYIKVYKFKFWDFDSNRAKLSTKLAGYTDNGPDEEDLDNLYSIIVKHKNNNIYAHCEAGISRSGAIREFLESMGWKVDMPDWQIHPNQYILQGLLQRQREKGLLPY